MAQQSKQRIVHYYDEALHRILCGETDPGAHWTIRTRVNCALCSALLRERQRPPATRATDDAAQHA